VPICSTVLLEYPSIPTQKAEYEVSPAAQLTEGCTQEPWTAFTAPEAGALRQVWTAYPAQFVLVTWVVVPPVQDPPPPPPGFPWPAWVKEMLVAAWAVLTPVSSNRGSRNVVRIRTPVAFFVVDSLVLIGYARSLMVESEVV
jgi:hypothetical protein